MFQNVLNALQTLFASLSVEFQHGYTNQFIWEPSRFRNLPQNCFDIMGKVCKIANASKNFPEDHKKIMEVYWKLCDHKGVFSDFVFCKMYQLDINTGNSTRNHHSYMVEAYYMDERYQKYIETEVSYKTRI